MRAGDLKYRFSTYSIVEQTDDYGDSRLVYDESDVCFRGNLNFRPRSRAEVDSTIQSKMDVEIYVWRHQAVNVDDLLCWNDRYFLVTRIVENLNRNYKTVEATELRKDNINFAEAVDGIGTMIIGSTFIIAES